MNDLPAYLKSALQRQRRKRLYRERLIVDGPQQVRVVINGEQFLAFCSNDYLGLANHPQVVNAFQRAADQYGVGSGASHLISGHSRAHHELEEALAAFTSSDAVILFSTGYMANVGVISSLLGNADRVLCDRLDHASILDGAFLSKAHFQRYLHNDLDSLQKKLAKSESANCLVASDAVFSMDGDIAPITALAKLCAQYQAWLMLDDAHGIGVIGEQGRGSLFLPGVKREQVPIYMATLGKAMGVSGAFVAGSRDLIEYLLQFSRSYVYTTAMPPALAAAAKESLRISQAESWRREKLQSLISTFRDGARQLGFDVMDSQTPIQPLIVADTEKVLAMKQYCLDRNILLAAIRSPTVPKGSERLRITLSALHEESDIDYLLSVLDDARNYAVKTS